MHHSAHNLSEFFEEYVGAILVLGIICGIAWFGKWLVGLVIRFFRKK